MAMQSGHASGFLSAALRNDRKALASGLFDTTMRCRKLRSQTVSPLTVSSTSYNR